MCEKCEALKKALGLEDEANIKGMGIHVIEVGIKNGHGLEEALSGLPESIQDKIREEIIKNMPSDMQESLLKEVISTTEGDLLKDGYEILPTGTFLKQFADPLTIYFAKKYEVYVDPDAIFIIATEEGRTTVLSKLEDSEKTAVNKLKLMNDINGTLTELLGTIRNGRDKEKHIEKLNEGLSKLEKNLAEVRAIKTAIQNKTSAVAK